MSLDILTNVNATIRALTARIVEAQSWDVAPISQDATKNYIKKLQEGLENLQKLKDVV